MKNKILCLILSLVILSGCSYKTISQPIPMADNNSNTVTVSNKHITDTSESQLKEENNSVLSAYGYNGSPYIVINDNQPFFTEDEKEITKSFEKYSDLDNLGRCKEAFACIGKDLMPQEDRKEISYVYPSGWKYNGENNNKSYDNVDGGYIYNRCHLIGFQLTGENANEKNLITGTRYMNVEGMLPFENMIADYIYKTGNHVLYKVKPIYTENNLVADGVIMEAWSIEDQGNGICFNVFCYNVQPGIVIDYSTGKNYLFASNKNPETEKIFEKKYILNTSSKKIHLYDCSAVNSMNEKNKEYFNGNIEELYNQGYEDCKICNP